MRIISLSSDIAGPACAISRCINTYSKNNYPTNIFDYLEISLLSIIEILKIKTEALNIDNKLRGNNEININKDNKNSVKFNNFNKIISHHDLQENYSEEDYNNFIEKYKRRFYRLINIIENEDKIFFIRYGTENNELILNFMNEVNKINPNLNMYFINVNYDEHNNIPEMKSYVSNNYHYINFFNYINYDIQYDNDLYFKTLQFNWNIVFNFINEK